MASPAIVTEHSAYAKFWREFQQEIQRQVKECNAVAGFTLWVLLSAGGDEERIGVASARRPGARVECTLDDERGLINCSHTGRGHSITFRLRCADGLLIDGSQARTARQASAFVLGQLVGGEEA